MKDQAFYVPFICVCFLLGLIVLGEIPNIKICGYEVKTLNMFSDVLKEEKPVQMLADIPKTISVKEPECPDQQICIEDYSENKEGFKQLFSSIQNIQNGEKIRIAFFGDSFIEGDVFCGDFRDMLQNRFGGEGVGYVPITSAVSMFRKTIKEEFKGFNSFDVIHNPTEKVPYPPAGECAVPQARNFATYYSSDFSEKTKLLPGARILYQSDKSVSVTIVSDSVSKDLTLPQGEGIQFVKVEYPLSRKVRFSFQANPGTFLYGISFEGGMGIYVDNFSLRGNAGTGLLYSKPQMHKALDSIQEYKLIILQYGTNAINAKTKKLGWYAAMMNKVISRIKQDYPQAAILLLSVADRSYKNQGVYITMPSVKAMVEVQRSIAAQNKIAFWDLYEAMGGENSMVDFVNAQPVKASLDYTHLNFLGGREIAEALYKSVLFEYEKYEKK